MPNERIPFPSPERNLRKRGILPLSEDNVEFPFLNLRDERVLGYAERQMGRNIPVATYIDSYLYGFKDYDAHQQIAFYTGASAMHYALRSEAAEQDAVLPRISPTAQDRSMAVAAFKRNRVSAREPYASNDILDLVQRDPVAAYALSDLAANVHEFTDIGLSNAFVQGGIEVYNLHSVELALRREQTRRPLERSGLDYILISPEVYQGFAGEDADVFKLEQEHMLIHNPDFFDDMLRLVVPEEDGLPKVVNGFSTFRLGVLMSHLLVRRTAERREEAIPHVPKGLAHLILERESLLFSEDGEDPILLPPDSTQFSTLYKSSGGISIPEYQNYYSIKAGLDFGLKVFEVTTEAHALEEHFRTPLTRSDHNVIDEIKHNYDTRLRDPKRIHRLRVLKQQARDKKK